MNQKRKVMRLENFNYNEQGAYFITICTHNRKYLLSDIVGTGVPDGPSVALTKMGLIAEKYLIQLNDFYNYLSVDKYVIMPNHIHFILSVNNGGPSGTPVPTDVKNSTVSQFISTFKRFCNKEYGCNIWQRSFYDHIIRNQTDYNEIYTYIETNPKTWQTDELNI